MTTATDPRMERLGVYGFDASYYVDDGYRIAIRCSQCEVVGINGIPCHETGCPNETKECHGCNEIVPARVRYCADCA